MKKSFKVYFRDICLAHDYREFLQLRKAIEQRIHKQRNASVSRCLFIIDVRSNKRIKVHKSRVAEFENFLFTIEPQHSLLRKLDKVCQLEACDGCGNQPEFYFTLN